MSTPDPVVDPSTDAARKAALTALHSKANFWRALGSWVILSIFFTVIWWLGGSTSEQRGGFWPAWAMLGIGIGVLFMALNAFGPGKGGPSEQQIQEQMRKMQ